MKLSDLADEHPAAPVKGPPCTMGQIAERLDADDLAVLDGWMGNRSVTGSWIARQLVRAGHQVAPQTVQRHRRGECKCGRATVG